MQITDRKRPFTVRTDRDMDNTDRYDAGVLDNPHKMTSFLNVQLFCQYFLKYKNYCL